MGVVAKIVEFLKSVLEYLSGPKLVQVIETVANVIQVIVSVLDMFNEEPSNPRKREYAWAMMKFLKVIPLSDFEKIVEAKRSGALDSLEDCEMDAAIGIILAEHVKRKAVIKKALGTKP